MIAPLQVIILLLIVAAFSAAPLRPPLPFSPWMVIGIVVLAHGLLLLQAHRRFQRIDRNVQAGSTSAADAGGEIQRLVQRLMASNTLLLAADLWLFGLGWLIKFHWNVGQIPVLSSVIWLAAPVLTWLTIWYLEYPMEVTLHRQTEMLEQRKNFPSHPLPSRMQYVNMQFRHGLSLLIVLLAFDLVMVPLTMMMNRWNLGNWSAEVSLLPALVLLLVLPAIVVHYWRTTRLPDGPLRTCLEDLSRRKKVGFMDIRIWNTYYRIPNAAILGMLPWCRYFLLTDLLLERLDPGQVEAVFAHEVGHGHHRHIWWYLLTFAAADLLGTGIAFWAGNYWSLGTNTAMLLNFSIVGVLVVFGFSKVSRLCEHQADWFAARHIADRIASAAVHQVPFATVYSLSAPPRVAPSSDDLSAASAPVVETAAQAGARIFSESLTILVGMANRPRDRAGWMHPSTQNRVDLLATLAVSREEQQRFNRRIRLMRMGIVVAAAAGMALTFWAVNQ